MTRLSDRSPSAHECPSSRLAAPAEAGQGVDTSFDQYLERKREALKVLKEMFYREKSGSPEYEALLEAVASVSMLLKDADRA